MIAQHRIRLPDEREVHISSLWRAKEIFHTYDWVVSLMDPSKDPQFRADQHKIFHVDDTEHPTEEDWLLSERDVKEIINQPLDPGQKALIHCHAGISRSTAIGIMTAFKNGASLEAIQSGLDWTIADPNMLILGWSKCVCGTDLVPVVSGWVREALRLPCRNNWRYDE